MDSYLTLEVTEWGISFSTAQLDWYLSWLGLGIVLASVVAYKVYQYFRKDK
jgi:hypothetical protein